MKTMPHHGGGRFFYPRPILLHPVTDGHLVTLQGATRGLLRTPAQLMQQPSDMIDVIAHAEAALDQLRHPRAGPQIGVKARRLGALHEQPLEPCSLLGLELGRTSGGGLGPYTGFAPDSRGRLPTAHAAPIGADAPGDLHRLESLARATPARAVADAPVPLGFPKVSLRTSGSQYRTLFTQASVAAQFGRGGADVRRSLDLV